MDEKDIKAAAFDVIACMDLWPGEATPADGWRLCTYTDGIVALANELIARVRAEEAAREERYQKYLAEQAAKAREV